MFREELLHHIWRNGSFEVSNLQTQCGKSIIIKHRGNYHQNAGPDFGEAAMVIDGMNWVGSVEIHVRSSDWYRHQHQNDPQYDNVILHVVWDHDLPVLHKDGTEIPVLELKNRVLPDVLDRYQILKQSLGHIPCAPFLTQVPQAIIQTTIARSAEARIKNKAEGLIRALNTQAPDWDELLFKTMLRSFGVPVNGESFETLANRIPFKVLMKMGSLKKAEAMLLGMAGFLSTGPTDPYTDELNQMFQHLKKLHSLESMPVHQWKFLRMRPASFPVFRLAQFAALINSGPRFFTALLQENNPALILSLFEAEPSEYWKTHYKPGSGTSEHPTAPGKQLRDNLLINAVVPVRYAYGLFHGNASYCHSAIDLLRKLSAEENRYVRLWPKNQVKIDHAMASQGLLHLTKNHCFAKQCLHCLVGQYIIDNSHGNQNE